jgi:hypothetical protein
VKSYYRIEKMTSHFPHGKRKSNKKSSPSAAIQACDAADLKQKYSQASQSLCTSNLSAPEQQWETTLMHM